MVFTYLDKRREHAWDDQNIRSNIPPLAKFHVGQVLHCASGQASIGTGFRKVGTSSRREEREEVALLNKIFGQTSEQVALGWTAVENLFATEFGKNIVGAHAYNNFVEGQGRTARMDSIVVT